MIDRVLRETLVARDLDGAVAAWRDGLGTFHHAALLRGPAGTRFEIVEDA